jgi:outer membrane protein assembly factor BamB
MLTTSFIDLGVLPPAGLEFELPGMHVPTFRGRFGRALASVVLLPLFLTVAAGAAFPPLQEIGTIDAAGAQDFELFEDSIYLVEGRQSVRGTETVSAYATNGAPRWTLKVPGWAPETRVYETAGETVVNAADLDGATAFTAVDRLSGRQLWSEGGQLGQGQPYVLAVQAHPGRVLIDVIDVAAQANELYWLNTRTGAVIWKAGLPTGWRVNVAGEPPAPVYRILGPKGELLVVELSDAGQRRLVTLTGTGIAGDPLRRSLTVGVDSVVVADAGRADTVVHAYDPDTYGLLWERRFTGAVSVQDCGPHLCIQDADTLNAMDPRTGAVSWRSPPAVIHPVGMAMISQASTRSGVEPPMLVDTRTGARLADLDSWQVLAVSSDTTAYLMRPLPGRSGLWVGRLDVRTAAIQVLVAVPNLSDNCSATAAFLACQLFEGTIVIWRTSP